MRHMTDRSLGRPRGNADPIAARAAPPEPQPARRRWRLPIILLLSTAALAWAAWAAPWNRRPVTVTVQVEGARPVPPIPPPHAAKPIPNRSAAPSAAPVASPAPHVAQ